MHVLIQATCLQNCYYVNLEHVTFTHTLSQEAICKSDTAIVGPAVLVSSATQ